MKESAPISTRERALRLLSRRALSCLELHKKLKMAGHPYEEIEETLHYCREKGYLNDELLAENYASELAERNLGKRRVRQQLQKKGISGDLLDQTLEQLSDDEPERAKVALAQKLKTLGRESDPRKRKEKCFRFLVSRGFSPGLIYSLLGDTDWTAEE